MVTRSVCQPCLVVNNINNSKNNTPDYAVNLYLIDEDDNLISTAVLVNEPINSIGVQTFTIPQTEIPGRGKSCAQEYDHEPATIRSSRCDPRICKGVLLPLLGVYTL